jgi:hypothetical protein
MLVEGADPLLLCRPFYKDVWMTCRASGRRSPKPSDTSPGQMDLLAQDARPGYKKHSGARRLLYGLIADRRMGAFERICSSTWSARAFKMT